MKSSAPNTWSSETTRLQVGLLVETTCSSFKTVLTCDERRGPFVRRIAAKLILFLHRVVGAVQPSTETASASARVVFGPSTGSNEQQTENGGEVHTHSSAFRGGNEGKPEFKRTKECWWRSWHDETKTGSASIAKSNSKHERCLGLRNGTMPGERINTPRLKENWVSNCSNTQKRAYVFCRTYIL